MITKKETNTLWLGEKEHVRIVVRKKVYMGVKSVKMITSYAKIVQSISQSVQYAVSL
jgi:hypothetical protein